MKNHDSIFYVIILQIVLNVSICGLSLFILVSFAVVPELKSFDFYLIGLQNVVELCGAAVNVFYQYYLHLQYFYYACENPYYLNQF